MFLSSLIEVHLVFLSLLIEIHLLFLSSLDEASLLLLTSAISLAPLRLKRVTSQGSHYSCFPDVYNLFNGQSFILGSKSTAPHGFRLNLLYDGSLSIKAGESACAWSATCLPLLIWKLSWAMLLGQRGVSSGSSPCTSYLSKAMQGPRFYS